MKAFMIFLSAIFTMLTSAAAYAHTDHGLGEGTLHIVYHIVFWMIIFAVIYKGTMLYKSRKSK